MNAHELSSNRDTSKSERDAEQSLQKTSEQQRLHESADLYVALYEEDAELRELTEAAIEGWPA